MLTLRSRVPRMLSLYLAIGFPFLFLPLHGYYLRFREDDTILGYMSL